MEILPRDTFQRSCQQSSCRDLVHRSCQETSYGDLVQRPGDESIGLPQTSFLDTLNSLNRDLPLRSLTKIFCGDLLKAPCTDSLTQMRLFGTQKTRLHSSVPWPHLKMPIDSCLLFCFSSLDFTLHFLKHTVWGLLPIIVSIPPQSGFHFVSASPLWPNNAESELMRKKNKRTG